MINVAISFRLEHDDRFTVITERPSKTHSLISETTYDDENAFLGLLMAAELDEDTTRDLVVAAIVAVAKPQDAGRRISVEMTREQNAILGLKLAPDAPCEPLAVLPKSHFEVQTGIPTAFLQNAAHFYDFLMNSPTPFVMVEGPEHTFTFINPPYVRILGRASSDQILGLPVRKAIPELEGQTCLYMLDTAYETGLPQVRRELLNTFRQEDTGLMKEVYFDIVYHPVRDAGGKVSGVMAQATDVTERVLARQVSENRELKLYRLWAELETIYAAAPVGIAVIDAAELRLLRLNKVQAEMLGDSAQALVNERLAEIAAVSAELMTLIKRAAAGEKIVDVAIEAGLGQKGAARGPWSVSLRPSLNPVGEVETVTLIMLDTQASLDKAFALSIASVTWSN